LEGEACSQNRELNHYLVQQLQRLGGYRYTYVHASLMEGTPDPILPASIESTVELYADSGRAGDAGEVKQFMLPPIPLDSVMRMSLCSSVESVSTFPASGIGEKAWGVTLRVVDIGTQFFDGSPSELGNARIRSKLTLVSWTRGAVLATISVRDYSDIDRQSAALELATVQDRKILAALASGPAQPR
jgi:hypothetical protein